MDCREVQEDLERICLGIDCTDVAAGIAEHLEHCAGCRAVRDQLEADVASAQAHIERGQLGAFETAREQVKVELCRDPRHKTVWVLRAAAAFALVGGLTFIIFRQQPVGTTPQAPEEQAATLEVRWTTSKIGETMTANCPLVAGPRVFVLRNHSNLRFVAALDRKTGAEQWLSAFPVVSPPIMGDGNLLCWRRVDGGLRLSAIDFATCKELWGYQLKIRRPLWQKPPEAMMDSHVICWSIGRRVWVLDADTGEPRWEKKVASGKGRFSVPRIVDRYVAVADGRVLYLLNHDEGSIFRKIVYSKTGSAVPSPMIEGDSNHIYISQHAAGKRGELYCCDIAAAMVRWFQPTQRPSSFRVVHNRAYVRSSIIQAFDCETGRLMWSNNVDGCSPVAVARDKVYVIRSKSKREIVALNSATGKRDAVYPLPDGSCAGMTIADGSSYIATHHGRIYALSLPR